jgi:hypothetical protein
MKEFFEFVKTKFAGIGTDTLNWIGIIIGHCIFLPSGLALLTGLTDRTPGLDIVILVQAVLMLSFVRSVIIKDSIASVLHGLGWFSQSLLLAMIVFK